jgi:hypothetical protein
MWFVGAAVAYIVGELLGLRRLAVDGGERGSTSFPAMLDVSVFKMFLLVGKSDLDADRSGQRMKRGRCDLACAGTSGKWLPLPARSSPLGGSLGICGPCQQF